MKKKQSNKRNTRLDELERRILSLEQRTVVFIPQVPMQPYQPPKCPVCGDLLNYNFPHNCRGYKITC